MKIGNSEAIHHLQAPLRSCTYFIYFSSDLNKIRHIISMQRHWSIKSFVKSVRRKAYSTYGGKLFPSLLSIIVTESRHTDNKSFERAEQFVYLGTTLTNQNSIEKETKSRVKSGNACYHSVQNLLSSNFLPQNTQVKIQRTVIVPLVLYRCEAWFYTLRVPSIRE